MSALLAWLLCDAPVWARPGDWTVQEYMDLVWGVVTEPMVALVGTTIFVGLLWAAVEHVAGMFNDRRRSG